MLNPYNPALTRSISFIEPGKLEHTYQKLPSINIPRKVLHLHALHTEHNSLKSKGFHGAKKSQVQEIKEKTAEAFFEFAQEYLKQADHLQNKTNSDSKPKQRTLSPRTLSPRFATNRISAYSLPPMESTPQSNCPPSAHWNFSYEVFRSAQRELKNKRLENCRTFIESALIKSVPLNPWLRKIFLLEVAATVMEFDARYAKKILDEATEVAKLLNGWHKPRALSEITKVKETVDRLIKVEQENRMNFAAGALIKATEKIKTAKTNAQKLPLAERTKLLSRLAFLEAIRDHKTALATLKIAEKNVIEIEDLELKSILQAQLEQVKKLLDELKS